MYEVLSDFYDIFMDDVPYEKWCEYIARFLKKESKGVDIGCGTGAFTRLLHKKGFTVTGVDQSPQMLEKAKKKAKSEGMDINFAVGDATTLALPRPVDFITANCDVVNYLKNPLKFFRLAYKNLKEGGAFVFDISTHYKLSKILSNNVFTLKKEGITYIWENFYSEKGAKVDMKLTFFAPEGNNLYSEHIDEQTQYAHQTADIISALNEAGFSDVSAYGFLSKSAPKETEERVHFVSYRRS